MRSERRRRVLGEDGPGTAEATALRVATGTGRLYTDAASRQQQPRITDLIPQRTRWYVLLFGCGILGIAALETGYYLLRDLQAVASQEQLESLNLAQPRSISSWFCSVLFGVSAVLAALLYSIRRHRVDDYHCRYRVWLWVGAISIWLSVNEIAGVNESALALILHGLKRYGVPGSIFWPGLCGVIAAYVALRFMLEIRRSKGSLWTALLAGAALAVKVAIEQGAIVITKVQSLAMATSALQMFSELSFVLACSIYARYVLLEVEGRVRQKPKAPRPAKKKIAPAASTAPAAAPAPVKLHTTASAPAAAQKPNAAPLTERKPAPATKPANFDPEEMLEPRGGHGMSRAERKRLRREQMKQRAA